MPHLPLDTVQAVAAPAGVAAVSSLPRPLPSMSFFVCCEPFASAASLFAAPANTPVRPCGSRCRPTTVCSLAAPFTPVHGFLVQSLRGALPPNATGERNIVGVHQPLQQARFPARSTACSGDQPVCACVITGTRFYSAVSTTSACLVARYPVPSSLSPPAASRSPRDELRGSYNLMRPARICSALDRGTTDTAPDRKHMHLDRLVQDRT
jgi:hypothetical protein